MKQIQVKSTKSFENQGLNIISLPFAQESGFAIFSIRTTELRAQMKNLF